MKTKTYTLKPKNSLDEAKTKYDWAYSWISDKNTHIKPEKGEKEIELINFGKSITTDDALKEIDLRGYIPAPSNYLVTLGIDYPEVLKEKRWIVSLDEDNLLPGEGGNPSFLSLLWDDERNLDLAKRAGEWNGYWWFAVIRKSLNTETPNDLKSLTLECAIQMVKDAGYKVIKEM